MSDLLHQHHGESFFSHGDGEKGFVVLSSFLPGIETLSDDTTDFSAGLLRRTVSTTGGEIRLGSVGAVSHSDSGK